MWSVFRGILGLPPERTQDYAGIWDDISLDASEVNEDTQDVATMFDAFERNFKHQIEELFRASFGLPTYPQFPPGDSLEPSEPPRSLRDEYLKPGVISGTSEKDSDLVGKVQSDQITKFLAEGRTPEMIDVQPKFTFSSVTVRTIRRPDGSVETVRTERDHTGREESTVTRHEAREPGPINPPHDLLSRLFWR